MSNRIVDNMTKEPVTLGTHVSIREAIEVMQTWGMRHLPVVNMEDQLIGLVSDRDINRALARGLKGSEYVTEVMTENPYCVDFSVAVSEVAQIMADRKYGSAIVIDSRRRVRGIFTTTDALWLLAKLMKSPGESKLRQILVGEFLELPRLAI